MTEESQKIALQKRYYVLKEKKTDLSWKENGFIIINCKNFNEYLKIKNK